MTKSRVEKIAMLIMVLGIVMVAQPFVHAFFQWGFLVTILGIVLFTIGGHLPEREKPSTRQNSQGGGR